MLLTIISILKLNYEPSKIKFLFGLINKRTFKFYFSNSCIFAIPCGVIHIFLNIDCLVNQISDIEIVKITTSCKDIGQ